MTEHDAEKIREAVRDNYGRVATSDSQACGCSPSCCSRPAEDPSLALGYSPEDLAAVPEGANMGLGCGNPQAIAALKPGEVVLDLGSGGGFDCFLAARAVGKSGRVIGVDMTPEMVAKAKANAEKGGFGNVEFRVGQLENLPVEDGTVDVIISNCVINLSPDKQKVFTEAFRVLRPGGRLAVSDIVATVELPESVRNDLALHTGCIAGAEKIEALVEMMERAGFKGISITPKDESREFIKDWQPGSTMEDFVLSANIQAVKPVGTHPVAL